MFCWIQKCFALDYEEIVAKLSCENSEISGASSMAFLFLQNRVLKVRVTREGFLKYST